MWKLIEVDAVEKFIQDFRNPFWEMIDGDTQDLLIRLLNSLPQIDIVSEIEKMIEEYENEQKRISKWSSLHYDLSMYIKTLQELLQKFKS